MATTDSSDYGVADPDWYRGKPILRVWQLDEDSTRYDVISAAPSDEDLMRYWWVWAVVALVVGTASLIVFLGIATSPKARKNPFNMYLLYLAIPDFVFSLCCGTTCLLNALNGEYWAAWMCTFQQWYCVFGIGSNAWLNGCITYELYKMLKFSNIRKRYRSPSRLFVTKQALGVYLFMGFLGTWGAIDRPNWPFHSGATSGLACLPIEMDRASSLFFWLAFFPLFAGIPSVYITYVSYMVYSRSLLPPTGKRRLLTVYFGRLILVFYVMWLPTLLILFALASFVPPWVQFVGGLWSHLQGLVSAVVSLMKPDIYKAIMNFLTCQCGKGEEEGPQQGGQGRGPEQLRQRRTSGPTTSSSRRQISLLGHSRWANWFSMMSRRSVQGFNSKEDPGCGDGEPSMVLTPPGDTENPSESRRTSLNAGTSNNLLNSSTMTGRTSGMGSIELWPSQRHSIMLDSIEASIEGRSTTELKRNDGSDVVLEDLAESHHEEDDAVAAAAASNLIEDWLSDDEKEDDHQHPQNNHETDHDRGPDQLGCNNAQNPQEST